MNNLGGYIYLPLGTTCILCTICPPPPPTSNSHTFVYISATIWWITCTVRILTRNWLSGKCLNVSKNLWVFPYICASISFINYPPHPPPHPTTPNSVGDEEGLMWRWLDCLIHSSRYSRGCPSHTGITLLIVWGLARVDVVEPLSRFKPLPEPLPEPFSEPLFLSFSKSLFLSLPLSLSFISSLSLPFSEPLSKPLSVSLSLLSLFGRFNDFAWKRFTIFWYWG